MNARARTLFYLGFNSYKEYLRSKLWRGIRQRVFAAKGRQCVLCGRKAAQIHHRSYDRATLLGLILTFLEPICKRCHEKIEFTETGRKRSRRAVEYAFKRRQRKKPAR